MNNELNFGTLATLLKISYLYCYVLNFKFFHFFCLGLHYNWQENSLTKYSKNVKIKRQGIKKIDQFYQLVFSFFQTFHSIVLYYGTLES